MIVTISVDHRKVNGVYHSRCYVPTSDGIAEARAEGRSDIASAEAAVQVAMAIILAELARGRLAWIDYEIIEFCRGERP